MTFCRTFSKVSARSKFPSGREVYFLQKRHNPKDVGEVFPFLESGLVKERCRQDHQRVEPSACLVKALGDEVRGEPRLKQFLVLKGVVALCVGHGTAFKPAVKHLLHPLQIALALLRGDGDVINGVLTHNSQKSVTNYISCIKLTIHITCFEKGVPCAGPSRARPSAPQAPQSTPDTNSLKSDAN